MGTIYAELDEKLITFIRGQKIFFVATAPLASEGSVNVSPKGYDSLAIIDNKTVAYVDLGGSGIETLCSPSRERPHHINVLRVRRPREHTEALRAWRNLLVR